MIGIRTKSFELTKESLGRALIALSESYPVEVLNAGNCFCDICENILDVSLEWHDHDPIYLATAAVLYKKNGLSSDDKERLTERILWRLGLDRSN